MGTCQTLPPREHTPSATAYVMAGQGEPLVLIHGVGLRLEAWSAQIAALQGSHTVIALDMPGHGDSAPLRRDASLPDFVAWLERTLDELDCGPVNLAGHSMGALIALGHAVTHPASTRRVALLNAVYRRTPDARAAVEARARAIASGDRDVDGPLARWFDAHADARQARAREQVRTWLSTVDLQGYASAYRAFAQGDRVYAGRVQKVVCPALFLTGEQDSNSTARMSREMAGAARDGHAVIVPGQRHMLPMLDPDAVNAALCAWLERPVVVQSGNPA